MMEYHWYEDYWAMPRNLPRGHQFCIGYYQTQRALRFHVESISILISLPFCPPAYSIKGIVSSCISRVGLSPR